MTDWQLWSIRSGFFGALEPPAPSFTQQTCPSWSGVTWAFESAYVYSKDPNSFLELLAKKVTFFIRFFCALRICRASCCESSIHICVCDTAHMTLAKRVYLSSAESSRSAVDAACFVQGLHLSLACTICVFRLPFMHDFGSQLERSVVIRCLIETSFTAACHFSNILQ